MKKYLLITILLGYFALLFIVEGIFGGLIILLKQFLLLVVSVIVLGGLFVYYVEVILNKKFKEKGW